MFFEKMQTRKNDGFTLVELIVVIAILAILAGIAVPAYSGYIEKANVAADEQLLHAVNIAFLSAAAEHAGGTVNNASLTYGGTTGAVTVTGVSSVSSSGNPNMDALKTAFNTYYGTNNTAAFKTYSALYFNRTLGMFAADVVETYSYAGGTVALSKSDVQALANSPFVQNMPNGIEGLLSKVDAVMDFGAGLIEGGTNSFASLASSPAFLNSLAKSLGIEGLDFEVLMAKDPSTWTEAEQKALQEYSEKTGAIQAERLTALKEQAKDPSSPYYGKDDEYLSAVAGNQMLSTNAVLYAAQNSTTTKDELMSILKVTESNTNPKKALTDNMGGDMGKGLSQASAAYGLYTAYVYSLPDDYVNPETKQTKAQMISATSNPVDILNGLGDSGFQAYLNTAEAGDAFDAYMSAMDMINSSSQSPEAVSGVLTDGFSDKELAELFNQAIK